MVRETERTGIARKRSVREEKERSRQQGVRETLRRPMAD